jgi:hypothetical protein
MFRCRRVVLLLPLLLLLMMVSSTTVGAFLVLLPSTRTASPLLHSSVRTRRRGRNRCQAVSSSSPFPRYTLSLYVNASAVFDSPDSVDDDPMVGVSDTDCPRGYFLDSVEFSCRPLGPIGRLSQAIETLGPFRNAYRAIGNLFGIDARKISGLGVAFALSYSLISNINGSLTLAISWYLTCKRVRSKGVDWMLVSSGSLFAGCLPFLVCR